MIEKIKEQILDLKNQINELSESLEDRDSKGLPTFQVASQIYEKRKSIESLQKLLESYEINNCTTRSH